LRLRCLSLAHWSVWNGWSWDRFAQVIGIDLKSLRSWQGQVGQAAKPQGAPPLRATPVQRTAVANFIALWNRCCSFRDLEAHFPDIPRGELGHLWWAYAIANQQDAAISLRWTCPGTVWAIDYSHADHAIDDIYPYLLVVRDLASGYQIAALPCRRATGDTAVRLLTALFQRHPPPLVLKSDNGSHFVNDDMRALLRDRGITLLLSPPYYPKYNGACEAGIGSCKTRIHHRAVRDGDPTRWTSDHAEGARNDCNHRDWAGRGSTPQDLWMSVQPTSDQVRQDFIRSVDGAITRRCNEIRHLRLDRRPPLHTLIRRAIADALVGAGYLLYRSRPVPQPLNGRKEA
jgi:transposase InsO family protein